MTRWVLSGMVFAAVGLAQTPPPSADSILADAQAKAQASHRAIYTVFHASW